LPLFHKDEKVPYKIEITEVPDMNGDGAIDLFDIELLLRSDNNNLTILDGDGDFRSEECVELLKESDVVVTNPPFSLFKEFVALLMEYKKKFIILGNPNAVTYKEIFPLLKDNKIWIGVKPWSEELYFNVPEERAKWLVANKKEGSAYVRRGGKVLGRAPVLWYTNVDIEKRHEWFIAYKTYNEEEYPKYVTFDAIDVRKISEIPKDYYGNMGVPKTFIQNYNPDQFEIIGYERDDDNIKIGIDRMGEQFIADYRGQGGRGHYTSNMHMLCYYDKEGKAKIPFSRIIIRRKHEN
jgi:hypothetical protein